MKYVINLVVLAIIVGLVYVLFSGIQEPIKFRKEKERRKNIVVEQLENIRTSQELYREIRGSYAGTFEELKEVLTNDSIPFIQLLPDREEPDNPDKFLTNTIYYSAIDSINGMGIDLDNMRFVPFADEGTEFTLVADTTVYQSTNVPVVECMTRWEVFMGEFADPRFKQYDDTYDPQARIGFGSLNSPNLEGNWN